MNRSIVIFLIIFINQLLFAQDASGIIAEGSFFTSQELDVNAGSQMSDLDTTETSFSIAISETNKFIKISGVEGNLLNVIEFDSIMIDDHLATDYLASGLKSANYITSKQLDFDLNYYGEILDGKLGAVIATYMYDQLEHRMKFYVSFSKSGKTWFYNFYLDKVEYFNWNHGLMMERLYDTEETEYTTRDDNGEDNVQWQKVETGSVYVCDTSYTIKSPNFNSSGGIRNCFTTTDDVNYIGYDAMLSTPKFVGDIIFYGEDYDRDINGFRTIYQFAIKD